jgi:uncharacterized membrane-anchored protein
LRAFISNVFMPGAADMVFLRRLALLLGGALLASALVCWIAANWQYVTAAQKLAGTQILMAASALLAAWRLWRRPGERGLTSLAANALGLAAVLTGGLFALIGQIYQTGADPWQLFAVWALLMLPWALTLPTVFLLGLQAAVTNVAVMLFLQNEWGLRTVEVSVWMTLLNLGLLGLRELAARPLARDDPWRIVARALMAAALWWWLSMTLATTRHTQEAGWGSLVAVAALGWVYTRVKADAVMAVLLGLAASIQVCILAVDAWGAGSLPVLIAVLVLALVLGARYLLQMARAAGHLGAAGQTDGEPWFISAFRLTLMTLVALLCLWFVVGELRVADGMAIGVGAALAAGGVGVLRVYLAQPMRRDLGTVLAAAGFVLYTFGVLAYHHVLFRSLGFVPVALVFGLAAVIYALAPVFTLRALTAFMGIGLLVLYLWGDGWLGGSYRSGLPIAAYERLLALGLAGLAVWRWTVAGGNGRWQGHAPLAWALVCLALLTGWGTPALNWGTAWQMQALLPWLMALALAALPLYALRTLTRGAGWRWSLGAALALLAASVGWLGAPGVAASLTWLLMGRVLNRLALMGVGIVALLLYLARFYYELDTPLLHKAWVLGGTGIWLLLGALALAWAREGWRWGASRPSAVAAGGERGRWRALAAVAGLLLVLAVANGSIWQRERLLSRGQAVVLALAPVDPRSLMQGDYMALRFELAGQIADVLRKDQPLSDAVQRDGQGIVWLAPDPQGAHRLLKVQTQAQARTSQPPQPDAVKLMFRRDRGVVKVVTNAWFFPEGQAGQFDKARYGLFKVDEDGTALLVNLLDDQRRELK